MMSQQYLYFLLAAILVITFAEIALALFQRKDWNYRDSFANLGIYAGSILVDRLLSTVISLGILLNISKFALLSIPQTALSTLALFIAMDFIYYWKHRWEHEIRGFWAHHSVHHNSNQFNLSTALRVGWIGPIYGWIYFIVPVLIGFDPFAVLISYRFILLLQFWVHSEAIGNLGILEKIINTPSNHRVHHGADAKYLDKNYGGVFIFWDKLFGTYQAEEEKPRYGLVKPVELYNPISIVLNEPLALLRDIWASRSWSDALRYIYKAPGWSPAPAENETQERVKAG